MLERSIEAALAGLTAEVSALSRGLDEVKADTREARDGVNGVVAVMREQRLGEQIEKLRSSTAIMADALRSDVVHAHEALRAELNAQAGNNSLAVAQVEKDARDRAEALAERIEAIERRHEREDGAKTVLGWLLKHTPLFVSGAIGALMALIAQHKTP